MAQFRRAFPGLSAALLAAFAFSGCAYAKYRLADAKDCVLLGVEVGHLPFSANVKASIFNAGIGQWFGIPLGHDGSVPSAIGYGLCWRKGPAFYASVSRGFVLFGEHAVACSDEQGSYAVGDAYSFLVSRNAMKMAGMMAWEDCEVEKDARRNASYTLAGVELSAGVVLGARAGTNPYEILDFLLGFTTLDISGDDEEGEKPAKPPTPPITSPLPPAASP